MNVKGCYPVIFNDILVLDYGDYIIKIDNDNIYIDYKNFSMLYMENSRFENKDYSVTFFEKYPEYIASGHMLDSNKTEFGYKIVSDGDKIKVVEL